MISLCSAFNTPLYDRFMDWSREFKMQYMGDDHAYQVYKKWAYNDRYIEEFNSQNTTYKLGHNQFSGFDSDDFRKYLWGIDYVYEKFAFKRSSEWFERLELPATASLPKEVDWSETGAVTGVKDQGQCGSCWSFSATGALEGAYYTKYGKSVSFSEQQLVDCDNLRNGGRDHGCNGGLMDNAFNWVSKNGGLCYESDYPYVSGTTLESGACDQSCDADPDSKVVAYVDVKPNSDADMMTALSKQPVAIAIEADQIEFQLYKSGVFTGKCGTTLDHGVLVVGYGTDTNGLDYYKVKNSWSSSWGQGGYILLGRGNDPTTKKPYNGGGGQCGILMEGSFPVL